MRKGFFFALLLLFSGSVAAQSISGVSGTLNHGASITVSGSSFGTRPTQSPIRWDNFEAGTIGAGITGWTTTSTQAGKGPRYAAVSRPGTPGSKSAWQEFGSGNYNSGIALTNTPSRKFYVSGWVYGNVSGISRNVKLVSFRGADFADPEGRFDQYPVHSNGQIYTADCSGNKTMGNYSVGGTLIIEDGNWHRLEVWIDLGTPNGGNGNYHIWKDFVTWGTPLSGTAITSDCQFAEAWVQHYFSTDTNNPSANYYWDELYIDTTRARVEIGNASTWAASTHREIQPVSAWSASSVTFTLNRGSFSPGASAWLFVVTDSGAVSAGYPITLGASGGTTTYTVTPSAGANGSISPSSPQTINSGSSAVFTVTPNANYVASVGGTCGGTLTGTNYTTNAITANCTVSATFSSIADTTPPVISNVLPAGEQPYGTTSVTLQVTTNEAATCRYNTADELYANMPNTFATTGGTTHSQSGLAVTAGTSYTRFIRCSDAAGNANTVSATASYSVAAADFVILDNNGSGVTQSGDWNASTYFPGYYGTNYHYSPDGLGYWFQWSTALTAGTYAVYAWWPAAAGRPTDATYEITHSGGTATVPANQTANGSQWNLLGTYTFGTTGTVRLLSGATGTEGAAADAVRFVTSEFDEIPPVLSGISPGGDLTEIVSSILLQVTTNELSTCNYGGKGVAYSAMNPFSITGGTSHSSSIDVVPGGVYQRCFICRDSYANESAESCTRFSVPALPKRRVLH